MPRSRKRKRNAIAAVQSSRGFFSSFSRGSLTPGSTLILVLSSLGIMLAIFGMQAHNEAGSHLCGAADLSTITAVILFLAAAVLSATAVREIGTRRVRSASWGLIAQTAISAGAGALGFIWSGASLLTTHCLVP